MADFNPQANVVYLGKTDFRNQQRLFGVKRRDRRQHMYIIGKSGTGKSTLINNIVAQDIANGEGLCLVDPHGELVEAALKNIPASRMKDVVYFNPADTDFNIGFNILELVDPQYKHLVASGLMGIFTKIWANVWSARMEYILNNTVLALLDTPGSTLLGIPKMLVDKEYRAKIVANITDPVVRAFWVSEYELWEPKFRNEAIAPIQNKVGQFLSSAVVRNIVGQPKNTIDVFEIMNSGKILLVNLSKGRMGEDNSALLGAMIITKIQLAAMDRVRIPEDDRRDFYLFVDEFQNFATDSFASILSEARKYRLNLIVAHQYIGQLVTDTSTKVRDAIFGNVGTMIIFRVGAQDAEFLEKEVTPEFVIQDMVGLPNHHIYLKMMVDGITSRPFSAATLHPFHLKDGVASEEQIIDESRAQYTRSRTIVEQEIADFTIVAPPTPAKPKERAPGQFAQAQGISVDRFRQAGERFLQNTASGGGQSVRRAPAPVASAGFSSNTFPRSGSSASRNHASAGQQNHFASPQMTGGQMRRVQPQSRTGPTASGEVQITKIVPHNRSNIQSSAIRSHIRPASGEAVDLKKTAPTPGYMSLKDLAATSATTFTGTKPTDVSRAESVSKQKDTDTDHVDILSLKDAIASSLSKLSAHETPDTKTEKT